MKTPNLIFVALITACGYLLELILEDSLRQYIRYCLRNKDKFSVDSIFIYVCKNYKKCLNKLRNNNRTVNKYYIFLAVVNETKLLNLHQI